MALAGGFDDLPTPSADEPSVSELIRRADAEREVRRKEDDVRRREEDARKKEEDARRREAEARVREELARLREEESRQRREAAEARAEARAARDAERATRTEAGQDVADLDALDAADAELDAADDAFFAANGGDDDDRGARRQALQRLGGGLAACRVAERDVRLQASKWNRRHRPRPYLQLPARSAGSRCGRIGP
jgi:membrane protein involved in colicin uptake